MLDPQFILTSLIFNLIALIRFTLTIPTSSATNSIMTGAVREDGVTNNLVPLSYPAVSDWRVTKSIVNSLEQHGVKFGEGIVVTEGPFYGGVLEGKNELWQKAKVFAVEMEISVLFVIASLRGVRAGAVLTVDNYIFERLKGSQYTPEKVAERVRKMCEISLDALVGVEL